MAVTTFDFEPAVMKVIDKLKDRMHASSRAEVLRRAIALLNAADAAKKEGAELVFKKKDGKEQRIILG
jgi:hypothetical protein